MCRIAGIFNPKAENLELDILKMRDAMHRGGPDDSGVFIHPQFPLAFGHRRLSILDLSSAGRQPMATPDGKLHISFNGEVYNFKEVREDLKSLGHIFSTETDTEVILHSYQQWGTSCFERFNGMFALSIWDESKQEVVLARDHAGIKPLYYYLDDQLLVFASEVRSFKALSTHWDAEPMWKAMFLLFGHLPEPFSTLKGVRTLAKGTCLRIQLPDLTAVNEVFYQDDFAATVFKKETALEFTRDILPRAVKRHLISDAPIGLFLSGGIDSSLLTLLAAPLLKDNLKTLSIHFEEAGYSEELFQKMVIDITLSNHRSFRVGKADFENSLEDILEAMDQPSIDAINTYFISMYARNCGLKAVLSGLGADEIFGGYPSFHRFRSWKYLGYIPTFIKSQAEKMGKTKIAKLAYDKYHPMLSMYLMNRGLNSVRRVSELTELTVNEIEMALERIDLPKGIDYDCANSTAAMEMNLYMKNQLLKDADSMSMWHGIEIRVPFLDKELMQAITSVAPFVKFRNNISKSLLIESFATLLPAEIWHRKKQGFTFPFAQWLKASHNLQPVGKEERKVYNQFDKGKLHWSRYWAVKVAGMGKFN